MATVTVGSTPGQLDIAGRRGDKWGPFQCTPQVGLDLSGRTWLAQIRVSEDRPAEVLAAFVVDASDAATGVIRLTLLPAESSKLVTGTTIDARGISTLTPGRGTYFWDLQATLDSDATDVKTWFAGKVQVHGDVSGEF